MEDLLRDGFAVFENNLSHTQIQKIRQEVTSNCKGEEWGDASNLSWVKDNNPQLKSIMSKLWPEGYHTTSWCIRVAQPDCDEGDWHVDYPTHDYEEPYPDCIHGIQVIIALDDFTLENGSTEIIPHSHTLRKYPTEPLISNMERERLTIKAGCLALWDSRLWHRSRENDTPFPRRSLIASFASKSVPVKD